MGRYYILRGDDIVEEPDHSKWSEWYESSYEQVRCVASTKLQFGTVVTSFLAMNLSLARSDPPLLFETRVQGGWLHDEWQRYATLEDARAGHEQWVAKVKQAEQEEGYPPPGYPAW